ncbi:ATP-dependent DNA helicase Q4-like [Argiope bruennichi]|uniref:ATP-dependent DNA helicase Q4-like n=1 Tax=Argiope bruennichi TaxID=94029 RepID=UPI002494AF95|nr:ATP-dependent DNA helicase Q4-like [Argiope bruennichi]
MLVFDINELKLLKLQIKTWECEFFRTNSKKPSKEDIHQAPPDIKDAYRNYWKLKNKIENEREDVWSESFNKSNQRAKNSSGSCSIEMICDKIKQKSNIDMTKVLSSKQGLKDVITEYKNKLFADTSTSNEYLESSNDNNTNHTYLDDSVHGKNESPPEIHHCEEKLSNTEQTPINENEEDSSINSIADIKVIKAHTKFTKSDNVYKKASCVNLLYSSVNSTNSFKKLSFKQNIDEKWLDRCNKSILNDSNASKTLDKRSNQLSAINNENKFTDNDNNEFETPVSLKFISELSETKLETKTLLKMAPTESVKSIDDSNKEHFPICKNALYLNSPGKESHSEVLDSNENKLPCLNQLNPIASNLETTEIYEEPRKSKKRKLSSVIQSTSPNTSHKANHLKRKIASGTLNENFINLNIKKKKFSRGHRPVNVKKLKWKKWKQLKKSGDSGNIPVMTGCFKCGQLGHWAKQCNVSATPKETAFEEEDDAADTPLPTLEEAAKLAQETTVKKLSVPNQNFDCKTSDILPDNSTENEANQVSASLSLNEIELPKHSMKPLYEITEDGKPISTPAAVYEALKEMGYSSFRDGQESAVMRVLCGLSTLVVLPTGSGKSLCYQLPAYMYSKSNKSLAIVVSPLVSLMEDQVTGLPSCLHAVCLHSGMTDIQRSNAIKDITEGLVQILLVSPEAVISDFKFADIISDPKTPPISFVCIDEVHCISQWSHNFRPSYLQLYKVLTKKMGVTCILGLTATATQSTIEDITSSLGLKCIGESVIGHTNIPHNLLLSVSKDKYKDQALLQLLRGDRFRKCSSIIIYCIRRNETERLAAFIRTSMQDELLPENEETTKKKAKSKKRRFAWTAEAYHAGLAPPRRRSIQKQFMSGKLRIVVATVAFGMGLDKPDVRAVIHYNMPKNFESYVQEIGRAGRDGLKAHCHLFLDSEGNDIWEQQRHIYSNSIDRHTLRKLLKRIFVSCKCPPEKRIDDSVQINDDSKHHNICRKHEVAFPINETVQELDVKQENVSTLLCYLELHPKQWIEILSPTYAVCSIRCYGGSKQMHSIALKNPAIATAIALDVQNGKKWDKSSSLTFPVVKIASAIGWKSAELKRNLKQLEWNDMRKKTGVIVEFSDLAFHISAPGNLSDEEKDEVLDFLHNKVMTAEETELKNLKLLFSVFQKFSMIRCLDCCDEVNIENSEGIKAAINKYFARDDLLLDEFKNIITSAESSNEVDPSYIKSLIRDLICTHQDHSFTGRAIARIFHGIDSPCFPSEIWGKVRKFWRCLLHVNFNTIMKLANEELRNLK